MAFLLLVCLLWKCQGLLSWVPAAMGVADVEAERGIGSQMLPSLMAALQLLGVQV